MENDDVLDFAKYLGLEGVDADMYYESYYNIEYDYDAELALEAYYESAEGTFSVQICGEWYIREWYA